MLAGYYVIKLHRTAFRQCRQKSFLVITFLGVILTFQVDSHESRFGNCRTRGTENTVVIITG